MQNESLNEGLRETLEIFEGAGTPWTTPEVAERLDLGRRSTYARLERLVEHGRLETKKVGANARVWWKQPSKADVLTRSESSPVTSLVADLLDDFDVGIFVFDENSDVLWTNAATERYFGIDGEQVVGTDSRRLVEDRISPIIEDGESFAEAVRASDDDSSTDCIECHVTADDDREERWLERRNVRIESGDFEGMRIVLYEDITDRRRSEPTHGEESDRFESLVDAVEEYAIFTLDTEGYVRSWNSGAAQIKGYEADEIVGEHFSKFYTEDDRAAGVPEHNLSEAASRESIEDEGWRVRSDGSLFWANVTITSIRSDDGDLEGYAKVTRDMTERREREEDLRRQKNLNRRLLETVPVGVLTVEPDGTFTTANRRAVELLELEADGDGSYAVGINDVYDENGELLAPEERPYVRAFETGESVRNWYAQVESENGAWRWFSSNIEPMIDEEGDVERVLVAIDDVTQLKDQAEHLKRQRDDLKSELDEIFTRIDEAFLALDDEWRISYVNDQAADLVRLPPEDLIGFRVWDVLYEIADGELRERAEAALESQEPIEFEFYSGLLDIWIEVRGYPSETGMSAYFRDVTDRVERERELERYETIVETVDDGIYVLDEEYRFVEVNDAYVEMTGYDREELIGTHCSLVIDEDVSAQSAEMVRELLDGGIDGASLEADIHRADGSRLRAESNFTALSSDFVSETRKIGVVRDVSERVERERALRESERRYRTLVENLPNGAVALFDEELRYIAAGGELLDRIDSGDDIVGESIYDRYPDDIVENVEGHFQAALDGDRSSVEVEYAGRYLHARLLPVGDDEVYSGMLVVQDITERKEYERTLETQVREQEIIATLGQSALEDEPLDALLAESTELIAETLDNAYCKVLDLDPESEELLLRQGVGWEGGLVGEATVSAVDDDSQASYTLKTEAPVVVEDLETESRFSGPDLLTDHGVKSGISVVIGPSSDPWGILGTHDTASKRFTDQDVNFVHAVANILATAIDRRERERELRRQREDLAALNSLNEVFREISIAIIDRATREEIEATVCERLADSDSYLFAWIGDADTTTQTVGLRTEAGVDGYLDQNTISIDPEDERSRGPTGRAFLTGEMQTARDILNDPAYEPWRDHAREYGFRSSAAIPITHGDSVYAVLNVYTTRPRAFEGAEGELMAQVGKIVGHSIAAAERKKALMSDELVELEFEIQDAFSALDVPVETEGTITLDYAVPVGEDEFLVYGTATPDAVETVYSLVETLSHWEEVTVRSRGDPTKFELRLIDPPVLSAVADAGGYVDSAVLENGEYRMTIHLTPSADVRRVIETVTEVYPNSEMIRRQQIDRTPDDSLRIQRRLVSELTDRQSASLDAAYHAGFFEWPRETDGTEVAESMGVAPPTFHQHLRKAEGKVFDALFSPRTENRTSGEE